MRKGNTSLKAQRVERKGKTPSQRSVLSAKVNCATPWRRPRSGRDKVGATMSHRRTPTRSQPSVLSVRERGNCAGEICKPRSGVKSSPPPPSFAPRHPSLHRRLMLVTKAVGLPKKERAIAIATARSVSPQERVPWHSLTAARLSRRLRCWRASHRQRPERLRPVRRPRRSSEPAERW